VGGAGDKRDSTIAGVGDDGALVRPPKKKYLLAAAAAACVDTTKVEKERKRLKSGSPAVGDVDGGSDWEGGPLDEVEYVVGTRVQVFFDDGQWYCIYFCVCVCLWVRLSVRWGRGCRCWPMMAVVLHVCICVM